MSRKLLAPEKRDVATPGEKAGGPTPQLAGLENYPWQSHCHRLFDCQFAIYSHQNRECSISRHTPAIAA